jgi:hypothetical protein
MRLRNYPTKRKLLKDIENLRAENRHLSIELRNARKTLHSKKQRQAVIVTRTES